MIKKAYAKTNLFLKVLDKRNDGYHNLDMVMINISMYDKLIIKPSKTDCVKTINALIDEKDNLCFKALKLIKEKYNINKCVSITIKKNIPSQAGLGGGSSDCAQTLKALNQLWKLNLNKDELVSLAILLGSDVPFFIYNEVAIVQGKGEIVKPIKKDFNEHLLLFTFDDMKCSTKEIFSNFDTSNTFLSSDDLVKHIDEYYNYMRNDLEDTVLKLKPNYLLNEIKKDCEVLKSLNTMMSGSGSAIIGYFNKKDINIAYKKLNKKYECVNVYKLKTISNCK